MLFNVHIGHFVCFPGVSDGKASACNARDRVQFLGWEDPLEKEMATHSSILTWRIPWIEEPGLGLIAKLSPLLNPEND